MILKELTSIFYDIKESIIRYMFLGFIYAIFVIQIIVILFLILPLSNRFKRISISKIHCIIHSNVYVKIIIIAIILLIIGLLIESVWNIYKYDGIREEYNEIVYGLTYGGKQDVLLKLFRAQRNAYLTFMVSFNWIVLYGLDNLIK